MRTRWICEFKNNFKHPLFLIPLEHVEVCNATAISTLEMTWSHKIPGCNIKVEDVLNVMKPSIHHILTNAGLMLAHRLRRWANIEPPEV